MKKIINMWFMHFAPAKKMARRACCLLLIFSICYLAGCSTIDFTGSDMRAQLVDQMEESSKESDTISDSIAISGNPSIEEAAEEAESPVPHSDNEEDGQINPTTIKTHMEYQQDMDIPQGDSSALIEKSGILDQDLYPGILKNGGWILGIDSQERILILDSVSYDVKAVAPDGTSSILLSNMMEGRNNVPECVSWDGDHFIAWSESPNAGAWYDETNGAEWRVYLADLLSGTILLIDQDIGLRPNMDNPYHYLAPTNVCIADGFLSYISFSEREDGEVVQSVMLYSIAEDTLTTVYRLDTDPANNALGWTSMGGGKLAWSQAYLRPDALYEGFTSIYDLSTEQISLLETEENIINPCMCGEFLIAENNPNESFYDSEVVVYSCASNTWCYKIGPAYPSYAARSKEGVNLGGISSWGHYVTWTGNILTNVLLLDVENGQLYSIVSDRYDISNIHIYPGGLLLWQERALSDAGELISYMSFCILNE